jgi:uncharacterized membrane protein
MTGSAPRVRSVADLTEENVRTIQRIEAEVHAQRGAIDRFADRILEAGGSGALLWAHVLGVATWIGYNLWPSLTPFDPFPFTLLTLIASVEAIFLAIFILISQRHAAHVSERRSQLALQINLLTEQENTMMLALLADIAQRVGIEREDAGLHALKQDTQAQTVAEQIARVAAERTPAPAPPRKA